MVGYLHNWDTGRFDQRTDLIDKVLFATSTPDISRLDEDEFISETESNRSRYLSGDGPIFPLYETIRALYAAAKSEGRRLTAEEWALVMNLRRRTIRMWEDEFARQAAGEPPSFEYRSKWDR
ncbi:hypothetical protein [Amycolatopsis suaedae]|nr:hypothetical protein [Amycolatopsis suaedae]